MKTLLLTCALMLGCSIAFDAHAIPPAPPTSIQIDGKLLEAYNNGEITCKTVEEISEIELHLIEQDLLRVHYYNTDTDILCFDKLQK